MGDVCRSRLGWMNYCSCPSVSRPSLDVLLGNDMAYMHDTYVHVHRVGDMLVGRHGRDRGTTKRPRGTVGQPDPEFFYFRGGVCSTTRPRHTLNLHSFR